MLSDSEIRAVNSIVAVLSELHCEWTVESEHATWTMLDTKTILTVGSPLSNELSEYFLKQQTLLEFKMSANYQICAGIPQSFFVSNSVGLDHGVIVRMPNPLALGKQVFVCAGIGEWGTSGAAYYLWKNWYDLHHEFGEHFAIVVEVKSKHDHSVRRIFSVSPGGISRRTAMGRLWFRAKAKLRRLSSCWMN